MTALWSWERRPLGELAASLLYEGGTKMRVNQTTNLRIACVTGYDYDKEVCRNINLKVNPDASDEDLLFTANTIAGLQAFPVHSIDRYDNCDLTE